MHIGATWRIRLNRPRASPMRPYVNLLWPLVVFVVGDRYGAVCIAALTADEIKTLKDTTNSKANVWLLTLKFCTLLVYWRLTTWHRQKHAACRHRSIDISCSGQWPQSFIRLLSDSESVRLLSKKFKGWIPVDSCRYFFPISAKNIFTDRPISRFIGN